MDDKLFIEMAARVLCGKATEREKHLIISDMLLDDSHLMWFSAERRELKQWVSKGHTVEDYWKMHVQSRS